MHILFHVWDLPRELCLVTEAIILAAELVFGRFYLCAWLMVDTALCSYVHICIAV